LTILPGFLVLSCASLELNYRSKSIQNTSLDIFGVSSPKEKTQNAGELSKIIAELTLELYGFALIGVNIDLGEPDQTP